MQNRWGTREFVGQSSEHTAQCNAYALGLYEAYERLPHLEFEDMQPEGMEDE